MRSIWRIGRIKGIDINIDPSWLIIFGLITFSLGGVYFPREYPRWPHWLHLDIVSPEDEGTSVLARLNAKNVHQLPVVSLKDGLWLYFANFH